MSDRAYFPIFLDRIPDLREMSTEERGTFLLWLCDYVETGAVPEDISDRFLRTVFNGFCFGIDSSRLNYEKLCERNKENGKKGGRPKKPEVSEKQMVSGKANGFEENPKKQMVYQETQKIQEQDQEQDKDKDNIHSAEESAPHADVVQIIDYLNEQAGTSFKASTKPTQQHINARMSEGFTVEDFKTVISSKCAEWIGTEWAKFLRPQTLFGTKFESYLNAAGTARKEDEHDAGYWDQFGEEAF